MKSTRDTLIDTAIGLFLGKGYGAVGTAEICTTAKVNKGTFYHFFPSKSDLLIAALERYASLFQSAFSNIAHSDMVPEEKLKALFEVPEKANFEWRQAHGFAQGCLVGNMALELGAFDEPVRLAAQKALGSWRTAVEPIIDQLNVAGALTNVSSAKGARLLISMIQGGLVMAKTFNEPSYISEFASASVAALKTLNHSGRTGEQLSH